MADKAKTSKLNPDSNEQPGIETGINADSEFEDLQKQVKELSQEGTEDSSETQETEEYEGILEPDSEETVEETEKKPEEKPEEEQKETEELSTEDTEEERVTKLKGKTPEELAKMYVNLQKVMDKQGKELGELRQTTNKEVKAELEKVDLSDSDSDLMDKITDAMTPEQSNEFLEAFTQNPVKAIRDAMRDELKTYRHESVKNKTEKTVQSLKESTKDSIIPYETYEGEINQLLNQKDEKGRRVLLAKHGTDAYEVAYQKIYSKHFGEEKAKLDQQIIDAKKELETIDKRKRSFTEPQSVSPLTRGEGTKEPEDMSFEELRKSVVPKEELDRIPSI